MPSASVKSMEDQRDSDIDPFIKINRSLDRKIRNLERRRIKLEKYKEELDEGKELDADQSKAVEAYDSVVASISLCQEFASQLTAAIQENEKTQKAHARKRQEERAHHDSERIKQILKLLDVRSRLKNDTFRDDFKSGNNGAVQIPEERLNQIMQLGDHIFIPTGTNRSRSNAGLKEQLSKCAENMALYLDGKNKPVMDTTYREMRMAVLKIANTTYPKPDKKSNTTSPTPVSEGQSKTEMMKDLIEPSEPSEVTSDERPEIANNGDCAANGHLYPAPEFAEPSKEMEMLALSEERSPITHSMTAPPQDKQMNVHELVSGSFDFLQESQVTPDRLQGIYVDPAIMSFGTVKPESLVHMHEQQKLILPSHPPAGFEPIAMKPVSPVTVPSPEAEEPKEPVAPRETSWDSNEPLVKEQPEDPWYMTPSERAMTWNNGEARDRPRRGHYRGNAGGWKHTGNGYRGRGNYRGSRPARSSGNRTYGGRGRGGYQSQKPAGNTVG